MPKYVIERTVPGAEELTAEQLHDLAAASNAVLATMGGTVQWDHSYVAEDRLFCVYNADSDDQVREHAELGGFPCDVVRRVSAVIDPVTGE